MKNIYSNIYKPNSFNIKKAKKYLENNHVIGLPTETVYGLAGNAYSDESIKKIYNLKKRPVFNPLIIHVSTIDEAEKLENELFSELDRIITKLELMADANATARAEMKLGGLTP